MVDTFTITEVNKISKDKKKYYKILTNLNSHDCNHMELEDLIKKVRSFYNSSKDSFD